MLSAALLGPAATIMGTTSTIVSAATVTAPSTTDITVHKLMYDVAHHSDHGTVTNNGEAQQMPSYASNYDPAQYGKVEFTAYDITDQIDNVRTLTNQRVEELIHSNTLTQYTSKATVKKTVAVDANGTAKFTGLAAYQNDKHHVWAIIETKHATGLVNQIADPMVVITPMTNAAGDNYLSNIQLYPKNETKKLTFNLTKLHDTTDGKTAALAGAKFQLYKGKPGSGTKMGGELTADKNGLLKATGLTVGDYYFVELPSTNVSMDGNAGEKYVLAGNALNNANNKLTFSITENGVVESTLNAKIVNYKSPEASKKPTNGVGTDHSFDIGDTVNYEGTIDVPHDIAGGKDGIDHNGTKDTTSPYTKFNWTDTPGVGLTYVKEKGAIKVKGSDGTTLSEGTDYVVTGTDKGFNVNFLIDGKVSAKVAALAGKKISINYNMVINEQAKTDADLQNNYDLTWNNGNGNDNHEKGQTAVHTYGASFLKESSGYFGSGVGSTPLEGAKFVLQNAKGEYFNGFADSDKDGIKQSQWVKTRDEVKEAGIFTSGEDGKFDLNGFEEGDYQLTEIQAPDGYQLLTHKVDFKIAKNTHATVIKVDNDEKTTLPLTGGQAVIIGLIGAGAVMGVGVYAYKRNKDKATV